MTFTKGGDDVNIDNYPQAHRSLWKFIGACFGLFSIVYGAGNAVQGNQYVSGPSFKILENIPGGMHTHGILMVLIGIGLMIDCRYPDATKSHPAVRVFFGYCVLVSVSIFGSWWIEGAVKFSTPWFWIVFALAAAGLVRWPPPIDLRGKPRA